MNVEYLLLLRAGYGPLLITPKSSAVSSGREPT